VDKSFDLVKLTHLLLPCKDITYFCYQLYLIKYVFLYFSYFQLTAPYSSRKAAPKSTRCLFYCRVTHLALIKNIILQYTYEHEKTAAVKAVIRSYHVQISRHSASMWLVRITFSRMHTEQMQRGTSWFLSMFVDKSK
jgi:hypothetical protein